MSIVVGGKFNQILNRIAVFLVIFINGLMTVSSEDCGPEALEKCAAPLTLISSVPGMSMAAQRQELDEMCPQLFEGMICIRSYTRRCMSLGQRRQFLKLFHGPQQVIRELCREGSLQHEFLRHSPCLKTVDEYKQCAINYQDALMQVQLQQREQNDISNHTSNLVCCSFRQYVSCSESVINKKCGAETAMFTRKFMNQMTVPMINEYCEMSNRNHVCDYESFNTSFGTKLSNWYSGFLIWLVLVLKMVIFNQ